MALSSEDRAILDLENQHWRYPGRKLAAITQIGINETRYGQRLVELARDPDAAAEYPLLVARLNRRLAKGLAQRSRRRAG